MKGRVSVDGSWNMFDFEDCLSENGLEIGFFPDELINDDYDFGAFLKDYMITALSEFSEIIHSFYFNIICSREKLKIVFKYKKIMEKGLMYYDVVKKIVSLFGNNLVIPIETSFIFN